MDSIEKVVSNMYTTEDYPTSKKGTSTIENYHSISVGDPFRWLEEDQAEETKDWVSRQNDVTLDYLQHFPFRNRVADRIDGLVELRTNMNETMNFQLKG